MTSTRNPLQDFILTPQQQNLLFAALNSNRPSNGSHINNGLNLSPSYTESPAQNGDANGFQESPFLDYDYSFDGLDTSYDLSFNDGNQPKMIGDLPGTSREANTSSTSPEGDSPDKRSHPDDEEEDENEPKRRESTEKVPKKPGRKPLTSEPTSKRKAQNRAAQRAFRERKEKHVKDLETKVAELEKASDAAKQENGILRSQVDKMTIELNQYKKRLSLTAAVPLVPMRTARPTFGNPIFSNINDVNFQFEFPKFGQLPGPPTTNSTGSNSVSSAVKASPPNSGSNGSTPPVGVSKEDASPATSYTIGLDAQTKEDLAKFSGVFSPPLTNGALASASRNSMDSHYSMGGTSTSSPSASSNSNHGPSSSCGTSPEPFTQSPLGFKPVDTLSTIGEEQANATESAQVFGHFASIDVNDMNWLTPNTGFQFDPQLFGDYREPQENILANGGLDDSFFNDAFDSDFITPYNMAPSPVVPKKDLIAEIDAAKEADTTPVAAAQLTCNKIWEKLQGCPKVQSGDFDLDGLCSDLQKKAKCSGQGPFVDEQDFEKVMKKYLASKDGTMNADAIACADSLAKSAASS